MDEPLILWRWWITDERTGKRRLTKYHMTEQDALERHADAEREPSSREGTAQLGQRCLGGHKGLVAFTAASAATSGTRGASVRAPES